MIIKKLISIWLFLSVLLMSSTFYASAQSSSYIPPEVVSLQVENNRAVVSLAELGYSDSDLISPYDSTSYFFNIPVNWQLTEGGEIKLDYDVFLSGSALSQSGVDQTMYTGSLSVVFNGQVIGTIDLDQSGSQSVQLPIPASALVSPRRDGRNVLEISLGAQLSCRNDLRVLVTIKATSTFGLPFAVSAPALNLARLPSPFYLRNSLLPDKTLLVVSDTPSPVELQAALNLMAGFGSLIGRDFDFNFVTVSQLTNADYSNSNFIFVGTPDKFERLSEVAFPLPVANKSFSGLPANSENDGVLELAVSPWNPNKSIMLVSGASDIGVAKSAQAASSGNTVVYTDPTLVYVSDTRIFAETPEVSEDFTLKDLGYATETLEGVGVNSVDYSFNVAKTQVATRSAYFELLYYHSGIMDYSTSSFAVYLNDQIISSVAFTKETTSVTTLQIKIPPGVLRYGENRLSISARMQPFITCDSTGFSDPWLTISDQSKLHVPVSTEDENKIPSAIDLKFVPKLLLGQSDLGDIGFVLPKSDPSAWKIASKLSYLFGREAAPQIPNMKVAFADDVPQEFSVSNSMIAIGKAVDLPILQEINDELPAPFDFTNNTASEKQMQIVYRLPDGVSIGYLEILPSPFNSEKALLVISGNTNDGVPMAGNALLLGDLSSQLNSNFAITNGTQVTTSKESSIFSIVGTAVPGSEQVVATPLSPLTTTQQFIERPGWLPIVLIILSTGALGIAGFAFIKALSRRPTMPDDTQPRKSIDVDDMNK